MKKILLLSTLLLGLTACSSTEDELVATITNALLNGTWTKCEIDGTSTSFKVTMTLNNGTGTSDVLTYANTTCAGNGAAEPQESITYTLGADVTVDGSVAGITTATAADISFNAAPAELSVVAIQNLNTLYVGDNGTTTTRATVLGSTPFTLVTP